MTDGKRHLGSEIFRFEEVAWTSDVRRGINKPHFLHTLNCGCEVLSQLVPSAQGAALILHPLKMLHLSLWKFLRLQ